ncbi:MAG: Acyl-CoA dehydrogenase [Smithella sp. PtaU1.Bin162]|nr:MAG: Acyl-CoA dehydrogenase [Smithella sp. PtaU1.Bin162]
MGEKFVSERNLKFMIYEVFDATSLLQYPYYADHSEEMFNIILDAAMKMAKSTLKPCFVDMDKKPPEFVDGKIKVHPMVRTVLQQFGEGGWISAAASMEHGGQQLPQLINMVTNFIFSAANYSASIFPSLCTGAAHLITSFGSQKLIDTYVPKMYAGQWQGTMALTEPQAGSSLADITTVAEPIGDGVYKIKGQKIFISASDHDSADNIINLLLAKIKGAPAGVRGISLFVVPKKRLDERGNLVDNDISITAMYHKMGYKGTPLNQLSLGENDNCYGYLVGEPHNGLSYMFQMMNEFRISIGACAAAIASAAYYEALDYTKERRQGRGLSNKDPHSPQVPIIDHADIKRMLMFARAIMEGSFSLLCQCAKYADLGIVENGEEKERNELLLGLLTPVAKTYPSEMAIQAISATLQCMGGYGYCDEFQMEQHYRDARIHPIHEGTTGIHGITLLGRNITSGNGKAFQYYLEEVKKTIASAREIEALKPYAGALENALEKLQKVTSHLVDLNSQKKRELFLADATLYLELFGVIAVAWQWLLQAIVSSKALQASSSGTDINFYTGKVFTCRYFFAYELPKTEGFAIRLLNSDGLTVAMEEKYFDD